MSFRELRSFAEIMRALGYPRLISMESFRSPNFELVADALYWLVQRHDPDIAAGISDDISTEKDRVEFLRSIAQSMATKSRIRLNTKKLYGADGYAVKELLKIANVLYAAMKTNPDDADGVGGSLQYATLGSKLNEIKITRSLASDITTAGASLYHLLGEEMEMRELRQRAMGRNLELEEIEKIMRENIAAVIESTATVDKMLQDAADDQRTLDKKIDRKAAELDRNQKRLKSLASVRPAFMDEYDKYEKELQEVYAKYLERFRNVDYLEHELERYDRAEQDKLEESDRRMKRLQKRLKTEELRMLRGETEISDAALDDAYESEVSESAKTQVRPSGGASARGGRQSADVERGGSSMGRAASRPGGAAGVSSGIAAPRSASGKAGGGVEDDSESEVELGSDDEPLGSDTGTEITLKSDEDLIEQDEDEDDLSDLEVDEPDGQSGSDHDF